MIELSDNAKAMIECETIRLMRSITTAVQHQIETSIRLATMEIARRVIEQQVGTEPTIEP